MKLLFDLLPLLLFFAAFRLYDVFVATAVAMAATLAQVAWLKLRARPVPAPLWLSLAVIAVFGGATLFFRDESFVKLKPTVLYWAMGGTLLVGRLLDRDLLRLLVGEQLALPPHAWRLMSWMWIGFFGGMGALNLYVAYRFPTAAWVTFKVFWTTGLLIAFTIVQALVLGRYAPEGEGKQAD